MMTLIRRMAAVLCVFLLGGTVWALSLEQLLGRDLAERLLREGTINEAQYRKPRPELMPDSAYIGSLINEAMDTLDPAFFVECLYLYRKPPYASAPEWSETERRALYNECLALSSLAGIEYFSTSRGEMRTFYDVSYIIDGPESKDRRSDPVFEEPPARLTLYARQEDLTFGDNTYKYDYYARQDSLIFVQENLTAMKSGIITMVGRNNLRSIVAVMDAGDYLLTYVASMAKAPALPGIGRRVGQSFSTRAEAILNWFSGQADKAYGKTKNLSMAGG